MTPEPPRKPLPSASDAWDALTDSHAFGSTPPHVREVHAFVGFWALRTGRWMARTVGGTVTAGGIGFAARHILHMVLKHHGW